MVKNAATIGKQRFIDRTFFSVDFWKQDKQEKPVIAYGNASFASTGRCEKPVPVQRIKRKRQKRYQTFDVDEYRTSRCCSRCGGRLSDIWRRQVRSRFVSRDLNAALNILACFMNPQRPELLRCRTE
eukprot:765905-Hanusia_phi.AAC.2